MKCHCLGLHCLPKYLFTTTEQLKFTKVIQVCVYYCILHIKCLIRADNNRADNDQTLVFLIGSNLVGSQPFLTWKTFLWLSLGSNQYRREGL